MISIITSLYKSERHLATMLKDVERVSHELEKIGVEHEFIFLPNNPSVVENDLLDAYSSKNLHIKKCIRALEPLYATWNAGIEQARYDIITFWNVDDKRFTRAFIDGIHLIKEGADIVYFPFIYKRYVKIWGFGVLAKIKKFTPPEFNRVRFSKEMHGGPFFMTTKDAFSKVGLFDPTYTVAGDFDWLVRSTLKGLIFTRSSVTAGIFKNDGTTLSGSKNTLHKLENERVLALTKTEPITPNN